MTRKKIVFTEDHRNFITTSIKHSTMSVTELANYFSCHPRTINRVMEELGISKTTSKTAAETLRLKKLVKDSGLSVDTLSQILIVLLASRLTNPDNLQKALLGAPGIASLAQSSKQRQAALFQPGAQASSISNAVPA